MLESPSEIYAVVSSVFVVWVFVGVQWGEGGDLRGGVGCSGRKNPKEKEGGDKRKKARWSNWRGGMEHSATRKGFFFFFFFRDSLLKKTVKNVISGQKKVEICTFFIVVLSKKPR